ncbi:MAG: tyrosine-type recombinase/integrase [Alphaproteobacteria bacterium]|nr:tyrosine-type recombinase/integrase [Alphaproteobacteria bacterium]
MAKALTPAALAATKPTADKRREIPDGVVTGLYFIVQPSGRKSWAVRYRANGRPRKLVLGPYVSGGDLERAGKELKRVRLDAATVLDKARTGEDPAAEKQAMRRARGRSDEGEPDIFDTAVRNFIVRHSMAKNRAWKLQARMLGLVPDRANGAPGDDPKKFAAVRGGVVDKWGHLRLGQITRAQIVGHIDGVADRAPVLANRHLAALRTFFRWAVKRGLLDQSPCELIDPPGAEKSRERFLSEAEVRAFWKAALAVGWPFGPAMQLMLLTGARREEVGGMTWAEVDLEKAVWALPGERTKNGRAHDVPLSKAAVQILKGLPRTSAAFTFSTTGETAVSGWSRAKAKIDREMLAILKGEARERGENPKRVVLERWTIHDLRRTAATQMAALEISIPVIERALNHVSGTFRGVVATYNRHQYFEERRIALESWAQRVLELAGGKPRSNVVRMRKGQK